jgi:N6-adenosine-specific RNA methylase IME4
MIAADIHGPAQDHKALVHLAGAVCTDLNEFVSKGQKFATIYADPPWKYRNQRSRGATDNHYPTMSVDDICALPVEKLAADNAHLHLWTTNAFLSDSFSILRAWGFTYADIFVWVKPQMGMGNYWRLSHEFMLLGVRGDCPFFDREQPSWIKAPRTSHSTKPPEVRAIVEKVSPGPRLELFGRKKVKGWTVWGTRSRARLPSLWRRERPVLLTPPAAYPARDYLSGN